MVRLTLLLLSCVACLADTNEVFLFCRNQAAAQAAIAKLDAALGYPNEATKTYTSVAAIVHSNGSNCVIRLTLDPVWSPRLKRAVDVQEVLSTKLTASEWGEKVSGKSEAIDSKVAVTRIDGEKAKELGFGEQKEYEKPVEKETK